MKEEPPLLCGESSDMWLSYAERANMRLWCVVFIGEAGDI